jgi:putative flippase GtrA
MSLDRVLSRLLRYAMTGGIAAVVDLGTFSVLCHTFLPIATAATLSFLPAALVNYMLSTVFVFNGEFGAAKFAKFLAFAVVGLAFNLSMTVLVAAVTPAPAPLAKAIGIGTAFLFNFWLNSVFVFTNRPPSKSLRLTSGLETRARTAQAVIRDRGLANLTTEGLERSPRR